MYHRELFLVLSQNVGRVRIPEQVHGPVHYVKHEEYTRECHPRHFVHNSSLLSTRVEDGKSCFLSFI